MSPSAPLKNIYSHPFKVTIRGNKVYVAYGVIYDGKGKIPVTLVASLDSPFNVVLHSLDYLVLKDGFVQIAKDGRTTIASKVEPSSYKVAQISGGKVVKQFIQTDITIPR